MTQLGAEIEQSVQNLEQEMKVSENQLNYLEVGGPHIHNIHTYIHTYIHRFKYVIIAGQEDLASRYLELEAASNSYELHEYEEVIVRMTCVMCVCMYVCMYLFITSRIMYVCRS